MKSARQSRIIELIKENPIETQEELSSLLNESGFKVTQATVSRDIRELGIIKTGGGKGRLIYATRVDDAAVDSLDEKYQRVLKEGFVSMDYAGNILVIKTVSGMAMAVAASLDAFSWNELVGNVAGDDTIMCAIRTKSAVKSVMEKINKIVGG